RDFPITHQGRFVISLSRERIKRDEGVLGRTRKCNGDAACTLTAFANLYSRIKPRRVAVATASVRLTTFIFTKMAFTCDFTVPSLMNSAEPISLLLFPL